MCGIFGAISREPMGRAADAWIPRALHALSRRGPDSGGSFVEGNVILGARRLRIHDVDARADQPFESADGRQVVVFNGAIFNYRPLREELRGLGREFRTTGDTEVAQQALDAWGAGAFARFDGMFAIAHLNRDTGRLLLGRDRLGIKPLYLHQSADLLAFASEVKPLLAHPRVPRALRQGALPEFVAFQTVMPPRTLFEGIDVLLPGHYLELDVREGPAPRRHHYWRMDVETMTPADAPPVEEAVLTSLAQCWDADREVGIQLSGGVDSSLVTALSVEDLHRENIHTYSVVFDDSDIRYYAPRSEEEYIREVCRKYGVANESYLFPREHVRPAFAEAVWHHEAPLNGPSTCLYMLLAKAIHERVTVLITGEGSDDIFLGYFNDWEFSEDPRQLFKMFVGADPIGELFGPAGLDRALESRLALAASERLRGMSPLQKATVLTVETVLHGLLARHDRMFMSQSIEGRPPFCADTVVRSRFGLPDADVHGPRGGKLAIKRLAERHFPEEFVHRKKIGFSSPFGDWCASPDWWRGYVDRLDLDRLGAYLDPSALRARLAMEEGKEKWSGQNLNLIFTLANFQLWHDIFLESPDPLSEDAWQAALPEDIRDELPSLPPISTARVPSD